MSHSRRSNSKGAFERAVTWWHLGTAHACRKMGRGAISAALAALGLREHANRKLFLRDGELVAFPGLEMLALWLGVNERTVRRGIIKLQEAGMVSTRHRFNGNNRYYLTVPPEVESQLFNVEAEINRRRHARQNDAPKCPGGWTDGHRGAPKCPTTSDFTSDLHSISKRLDLSSSESLQEKKEKMVAEEGRQEREPLCSRDPSSSPLAKAFRDARKLGDYGAPIVGKAINQWGRSPEEVQEAIDCVSETDGSASDLAHKLWQPDD